MEVHLIRLLAIFFLGLVQNLCSQAAFPLNQYGRGGAGKYSGEQSIYVPSFHTGGEFPYIGNNKFQLVSRNLLGGTWGVVLVSRNQANVWLKGLDITLLVDVSNGMAFPATATGTSGKVGEGVALVGLPIPKDMALVGSTLFFQGFFLNTATPLCIQHTQGLQLTFSQPASPLVSALYDRVAYKQLVTDANLGHALWMANAVKGFTYVGTKKYTCGKQTHWIGTVKDNKFGIEFMLIPGGSFQMGDGLGHAEPIHWVHVEPFLLARTEITQKQWASVMNTTPWKGKIFVGPYTACAANWITWPGAALGPNSFCGVTGWRLPSEAEWEYACRSGTNTKFFFGDSPANIDKYAWYNYNSYGYAHKVAMKLPNAFGLHDMAGNVTEWVQDTINSKYYGAPSNGDPWEANNNPNAMRVIRGGSQWADGSFCRSAARSFAYPKLLNQKGDPGFRPAISLR